MERLSASVDLQVQRLLLDGATDALGAGVALTTADMSWSIVRLVRAYCARCNLTLGVAAVFVLVLVFLITTVALGVMRLGLACAATVLALLDWATLRIDVVQFSVCQV